MTGYCVMLWIEQAVFDRKYTPPKKIFCHSQNPVGSARIKAVTTVIDQYVNAEKSDTRLFQDRDDHDYFRDRIS